VTSKSRILTVYSLSAARNPTITGAKARAILEALTRRSSTWTAEWRRAD